VDQRKARCSHKAVAVINIQNVFSHANNQLSLTVIAFDNILHLTFIEKLVACVIAGKVDANILALEPVDAQKFLLPLNCI
jgi:hypothetical protein